MSENTIEEPLTRQALNKVILKFAKPSRGKAAWQLADTLIPYFCLWALAVYGFQNGYSRWLCFIPILAAAPFLVRIFIIFHDCCHSSFFASKWANTLTGYITGVLASTPFRDWGKAHIRHHATAGNLDRRGVGDVWTLTVEEYISAPKLKRITYRIFRHPLFLFGVGPSYVFLIFHRFSQKDIQHQGRLSVYITNLAMLLLFLLGWTAIGYKTFLLIQLPITIIAATLGLWLFYVQHQYEEVYWARNDVRDSVKAALEGSSYYKLPKVAQWFTGNIGLHHIHHLNPSIPNYNLQPCHDEIQALQHIEPLGFRKSFKSLRIHLWDEDTKKLISFKAMKLIRKARRKTDQTK
ncbi:fatty acid desaturase [Pontiella sulfatireligans]|uniref:Fatty acid desaturase n=1 Tax=Pontiella sulfatireligans TaxID=2750658 RepID=A0A6C2UE71_9BACT|nr:fatty acid desaturase [Pontiella sulfatireligans]VGO18470.1 Fatty acid desaturase [Pontiella sulfatireligans]